MDDGTKGNKRVAAIVAGVLFDEQGCPVDCYVLDGGRRVLSQRGILRALRGTGGPEKGDLGRYIDRLPNRFAHLAADPKIEFTRPDGGPAVGRDATFFADICEAYASAWASGELHHTQVPLAQKAIGYLGAFAKIGIEAMVDEATGYQRTRHERELQRRFSHYLRAVPGEWERRFHPDLVRALAPLYGIRWEGGSYPRALRTPFAMIYTMVFGDDFTDELRRRNPNPESHCHHELLTEPGAAMLASELAVVTLLAQQSASKAEFWARMRNKFEGEPMPLSFGFVTPRSTAP